MFRCSRFQYLHICLAIARHFSITPVQNNIQSCKVLVVGGGSGGCAVAAKLSRKLKKSELVVLEPSSDHYYQPVFTLVGGGIEKFEACRRNAKDVLPANSTWIRDAAQEFDLKNNTVTSVMGHQIKYEHLVVATGIIPRYEQIPGLVESLSNNNSGVCSVFDSKYIEGVYPVMQKLNSGNAIFTLPNSAVKGSAAAQKICYITDHYLRKEGKRNNVNIIYNTSWPVIFPVTRYAKALEKLCKERNINVNTRTNLVSIDSEKKEATFENLDNPNDKKTLLFSMLHITPPMSTTKFISENKDLTNDEGFVEVDKSTLQHVRFPNVFAIGDCSSSPTSKTAGAASVQTKIVYENLLAVMKGKILPMVYDGYASCPIVTGYDTCILAEFDYDLTPLETFPFDQDKERSSMFLLKKYVLPTMYWSLMMKGYWNGPGFFRKIMHFGKDR